MEDNTRKDALEKKLVKRGKNMKIKNKKMYISAAFAVFCLIFCGRIANVCCQLSTFVNKEELTKALQFAKKPKKEDFSTASEAYVFSMANPSDKFACNYMQTKLKKETPLSELFYVFSSLNFADCDLQTPKSVINELKKGFGLPLSSSSSSSDVHTHNLPSIYYSTCPLIYLYNKKQKLSPSHADFFQKAEQLVKFIEQNYSEKQAKYLDEEKHVVMSQGLHAAAQIIKFVHMEDVSSMIKRWLSVFKKAVDLVIRGQFDNQMKELNVLSNLLLAFFNVKDRVVRENMSKQLEEMEEFQSSSSFISAANFLVFSLKNTYSSSHLLYAYPPLKEACVFTSPPSSSPSSSSSNLHSVGLFSLLVEKSSHIFFCDLLGNPIPHSDISVATPKSQQEKMQKVDEASGSCEYRAPALKWTKNDLLSFHIKIHNKTFKFNQSAKKSVDAKLVELTATIVSGDTSSPSESFSVFTLDKNASRHKQPVAPNQKIVFKARLEDSLNSSPFNPSHIAIAAKLKSPSEQRILNCPTSKILFFTKQQNTYQLVLSLDDKNALLPVSGVYQFEFLAGGNLMQNPIRLKMMDLELKFANKVKSRLVPSRFAATSPSSSKETNYRILPIDASRYPLPLIQHQFSPPAPQPHPLLPFVSFICAAILPFLWLLFAWRNVIKVNMRHFRAESTFHWLFVFLLLAEVCVILMYFLAFNLVVTTRILMPLTFVLVFVGNRVLCDVTSSRSAGEEDGGKDGETENDPKFKKN